MVSVVVLVLFVYIVVMIMCKGMICIFGGDDVKVVVFKFNIDFIFVVFIVVFAF